MRLPTLLLMAILMSQSTSLVGQEFNQDESKVPAYKLPDPLVFADGAPVRSASDWTRRRAELLGLFETQVYGKLPGKPPAMRFLVVSEAKDALDGAAVRKEIDILFSGDPAGPTARMLIYLPAGKPRSPVFLGLNFAGNHTVTDDPAVSITKSWVRDDKEAGVVDHRASEQGRGRNSHRWPIRETLARGYGVATIYYGDIDPDFDDGFENGVHPLFDKPAADGWGSIGAWAWGLSRALDYLETDPLVDAKRVAVLGHSRLGKTALWAGATDTRFALVISNNSGCGGAALSRRRFGETVARINKSFPHWFCDNFNQYNDHEDQLPVDQHELIALIAPRPVYVASASEDLWADPRGEFLSLVQASPAYRLLGKQGLDATTPFPAPDGRVATDVAYHLRPGKHDILWYDWERYIDFADEQLGK